MKRTFFIVAIAITLFAQYAQAQPLATTPSQTPVQQPAAAPSAQSVLDAAAAANQFTYLLFYRQNDQATQAMDQTLQQLIAPHTARATGVGVLITDPADAAVVQRFGVSRAPMPLLICAAPNGAVTGFYQTPPNQSQFEKALVTPTMTLAMKSMQEGKLVLVCASATKPQNLPAAAQQLLADPDFQTRTAVVKLAMADTGEERFVRELQLDPNDPLPQMAILAPPGMLVGKFNSLATKADLVGRLHAAGKCCNDPNCKHGQK